MEIKHKIEAILFATGKKLTIDDISRLTKYKDLDKLNSALIELQKDYNSKESTVDLFFDSGFWHMTIKPKFIHAVQNLHVETELDKATMETLAVIAWKYPILQAEVIRIRNNKAYDHIANLEKAGYITRHVFGRTRKITLTPKFFEYFDLPSDYDREALKSLVPPEFVKKIELKEQEIEEKELEKKSLELEQERLNQEAEDQKQKMEEKIKQLDEKLKKIELEDDTSISENEN